MGAGINYRICLPWLFPGTSSLTFTAGSWSMTGAPTAGKIPVVIKTEPNCSGATLVTAQLLLKLSKDPPPAAALLGAGTKREFSQFQAHNSFL